MDAKHFDTLTRSLSKAGTRRGLLGLLATLPLLGGLFTLLSADETNAKGRRKRRKKAHKHAKGRQAGKDKGKHKKPKCKPQPKTTTCDGTCGPVTNNCQQTVDCGSCDCPEPCDPCFICQSGPNTPGECVVDPDQVGEPCGSDGQSCQADGGCVCFPVDPCTAGVCGTVTDNCGRSISCERCPVISSFTATPATIDRGATPPQTANLGWSTSNATTCTLDDGTGPATVPCGPAVIGNLGPAATTTYTLTASNATGVVVSAQVTLTVQYCHAITALTGACPSGATQFCRSRPISATSSDDARAACVTCKGEFCTHTSSVFGSGWVAFDGSNGGIFVYESGTEANCASYITRAGDITSFQHCFIARWAPA